MIDVYIALFAGVAPSLIEQLRVPPAEIYAVAMVILHLNMLWIGGVRKLYQEVPVTKERGCAVDIISVDR